MILIVFGEHLAIQIVLLECKEVFNFSHHLDYCIAQLGPTSKTGGLRSYLITLKIVDSPGQTFGLPD